MQARGSWQASFRTFFWPSLLLAAALATALASSTARQDGQFYASAFLALLSLLMATVASAWLIPKLLARIRYDFINRLRFLRVTKRGVSFTLIVLVVGFSAVNTGNNLLILVLSFLMASLIVSGFVSNLVLHGLKISLSAPPAIHARQRAVFFVTLKNLKRMFPSFALNLRGSSQNGSSSLNRGNFVVEEKNFPCVLAGEEHRLHLHCEFPRRGVYSVEGFEVRTSFPFGFFSKGRELKAHGSIIVYPALRSLDSLMRACPRLLGSREMRRKGLGGGLYNIRPYQGGDSTRFVHWKSTAKLSQLMVKDFVEEEETPLKLIFSTFLPRPDAEARRAFEEAVSFLASLGRHYRSRGLPFMFDSGEFSIKVGERHEDYEAFMEYLACVEPSPARQLEARRVPPDAVMFAAGREGAIEGIPLVDYLQFETREF